MSEETSSKEKRTSTKAIVGLILSIAAFMGLGILTAIPAVILGHMARKEIRADEGISGDGLALAALILGYLAIFLQISLVLLLLILGSSSAGPFIYTLF